MKEFDPVNDKVDIIIPRINFPQGLICGGMYNTSALCTLWDDPIDYYEARSSHFFAFMGGLHSKQGIKYMLCNISASNVRVLWIVGKDRTNLVPFLYDLKEHSNSFLTKDEQSIMDSISLHRIVATEDSPDPRSDIIQCMADKCYQDIYVKRPSGRVLLPIPKQEFDAEYTVDYKPGHYINRSHPYRAWKEALHKIKTCGYNDEDNQCYPIHNLLITVKARDLTPLYDNELSSQKEEILEYEQCLSDESPPEEGTSYTYGNRIGSFLGSDQKEYVIEELLTNESSRKAVIVLVDPHADRYEIKDIPCLNEIAFRCVDEKLVMTAVFRSHDIYKAWIKNYIALYHFYVDICEKLDINPDRGFITIHSIDAHIYKSDIALLPKENIRSPYYPDRFNIIFSSIGDMIEAKVVDKNGSLVESFSSEDKKVIREKITPYIDSPSNGLWVGGELEKL